MDSKYNHENKKQILGKIKFHEQLSLNEKNKTESAPGENKILVIHTGGTIGMFLDENGKFAPAKEKFKKFLQSYPYFCDEDETYFNSSDNFTITPPSIQKKKIWYKFQELDHLIDSTNMNIQNLNNLLSIIEKNYDQYDAFVILHGTDTMSYTASALSFMIQNLKKTIVLTGAQIPIGQTRNDAANNLLSSLIIAGHFLIAEVLLVFDNTIFRGNRSTKLSASSLTAYKTPNFHPIGKLGLKIQIQWQHIYPSNKDKPTKFLKLKHEVSVVKLTPFGFQDIPSSKYVVVQSYGVGNIPTEGPFYDWISKNSKLPQNERAVIVNISQVTQSVILNVYASGYAAYALGLIPGSDMTCQAAIAKLSYLASRGYKDVAQLSELIQTNLRGELTESQNRNMKSRQNYTVNCLTLLQKNFQSQSQQFKELLLKIVYPTLVLEHPSKTSLNRLLKYNFNIHYVYPDKCNILHYLMKVNTNNDEAVNEILLNYLLQKNIDTQLIDSAGNSALFYAIQSGNYIGAQKIKNKGGILKTSTKKIFTAIMKEDLAFLNALIKFQDPLDYKNSEGRNAAFFALINKKYKICQFLYNFTNLFSATNRKLTDLYEYTLQFYMEKHDFFPENQAQNKVQFQSE